MKIINKTTLGISLSLAVASTIFLAGCSQPTVSEESLGLRQTTIYNEKDTTGDKTMYGKEYAGSGYKIARAYQDAPPMIPHDTEGMLPITIDNNQCTSCHMPDVAASMGATPLPKSHFTNFRPKHKFDGKMFTTTAKVLNNETSIESTGDRLPGARFNCTLCHAPQSTGKLPVGNTFKAVYSDKDGAAKSSWTGTRLTNDLDTNGQNSKLTDADYKNEHSAAGYLKNKH